MAKGQKSQVVTKKHLARQERERRQNRLILIVSIGIIVIVVGLIGYGLLKSSFIEPRQPVAKVANNAITTKQFQTFARYERLQLIQTYQQYQQFAAYFGSDQGTSSYITQYLAQIEYQLEPTNLGQSTLDYLIADQLIQAEAQKRNITVSDQEVTDKLQEYFGYFANGTPTTAPTSVPVPTSTLNPTQIALVPPTATAAPTATNTPTPVITVTQEVTTTTPTAVITPTLEVPTATQAPTGTPYTYSAFQTDLEKYMTNINSFADLTEQDFRWIFGMQLLRQKVMDAITADVSRDQDEVWARHIVLSDQAQAQSIYDRLSKGENFDTVATEVYSGTGTTSTDLGWFGTGKIDSNAEKQVFNMQIGQISEPIQTTSGWEIYQVLGHEVRTLTDADFETLKQTKFQEWIDGQKSAENVQTFDLWKTRVPLSPTIPPTQASQ